MELDFNDSCRTELTASVIKSYRRTPGVGCWGAAAGMPSGCSREMPAVCAALASAPSLSASFSTVMYSANFSRVACAARTALLRLLPRKPS